MCALANKFEAKLVIYFASFSLTFCKTYDSMGRCLSTMLNREYFPKSWCSGGRKESSCEGEKFVGIIVLSVRQNAFSNNKVADMVRRGVKKEAHILRGGWGVTLFAVVVVLSEKEEKLADSVEVSKL